MSEGAQKNNTRQRQRLGNKQSLPDEPSRGGKEALLAHRERASTGGRAGAARTAAPTLVEAYGSLVRKQPLRGGFRPDGILFIYLQNLLDTVQNSNSEVSGKAAKALLQTLDPIFLDDKSNGSSLLQKPDWTKDLVQNLNHVLNIHPALKENENLGRKSKNISQKLQLHFGPIEPIRMEGRSAVPPGLLERIAGTNVSDPSIILSSALAEIGPASTLSVSTLRETVAEIISAIPGNNRSASLDETGIARLIYFFSDKQKQNGAASPEDNIIGSLLSNEAGGDGKSYNLGVVSQFLSQDYGSADWNKVARNWDFPDFSIKDAAHFGTFIEIYRAGAKGDPPLAAFTGEWRNPAGQCSLLEGMFSVPPSVYTCPLNDSESADAATVSQASTANCPNPKCWASSELLQRLLFLSDIPTLARRIRDLFVKGLLVCSEVLLCALVRLQLNVANAAAQGEASSELANAGMQMKGELMRELIPLFFKPNSQHRVQNGPAALRRLWAISPNTVTAACIEAWRSTVSESAQSRRGTVVHIISIARLLPSPEHAIASLLNGSKDPEFSIAVAFIMADNDILQLKPWLSERISAGSAGTGAAAVQFSVILVAYLGKMYSSATPRTSGSNADSPLVSLENVATCLQALNSLDQSLLSQTIPASLAGGDSTGNGVTLGESIKRLSEACFNAHPTLRNNISQQQAPMENAAATSNGRGTPNSSGSADEIEEMANSYFQKIYTSEQSIGEVVEMLKRFKASSDSRENDIFACMIHNLFDEYRFFSKYPEKELRITGILFGTLIREQLVSSITLGIALRYVLEALRKPPTPPGSSTSSSGKMFRFGMFALEQFKGRLHEWPQYCSHIVQIPHLKDGYADLVNEIEGAMAESQNRPAATATPATTAGGPDSGASVASTGSSTGGQGIGLPDSASKAPLTPGSQSPKPIPTSLEFTPASPPIEKRTPVFGPGLGRAVQGELDEKQHEAPPEAILDRVQFLINNVSPSNVDSKAKDLRKMLEPEYFDWLGQYLVVKRISTQPNFHPLYLAFLDQLGDYGKGLVESILASVYLNVGKLLRSPKITTSTSERSLLKNLGSWLGQITLARNRPVLQIMLDCKELLFQGYENGRLIAVTPFVAKILEGAKNSIVFRPPNPWVMGLLSVFKALYAVEDLKMNIKFEVEVLCKNLNVKLEEIPLRTVDLSSRIPPSKEKNPDFNMKSSMVAQSSTSSSAGSSTPLTRSGSGPLSSPEAKATTGVVSSGILGSGAFGTGTGTSSSGSQDQQQTVIPNLAAYVKINPSLTQLLQQAQGGKIAAALNSTTLKRSVPMAVDRAIRESIQPVVERSVTIACITSKEIVTKDFAMESDENKMRKAAQVMVANLAGSLALATCRESLRTSVTTHMRQLLTSSVGSSDQLSEQEQAIIEECVAICATDNLDLGCMLIEKAAREKAVREMDEALASALNARRKHREQTGQPFYDMSIFGNGNQRYPGALPEQLRPKPGGLRSEQLRVYEAFQKMPRPPAAGGTSGTGAPVARSDSSVGSSSTGKSGQQVNVEVLQAIAGKIDSAVTSLLSAAGPRAPEVTFSMLPPDHEIRQLLAAVQRVMPNVDASGNRALSTSEKESVLGFSQRIFKRLYELTLSEPLRLEAFVALLETLNKFCPQLGKDIGTWATYAPTETESQRKLHRTVLLLLVRSRLVSVAELDEFFSGNASNGRNGVWVEFSLLFMRTAFLERFATPSDFPKLLELMTSIADGRSQASPQVNQSLRKPILRMLEELRASSSKQQTKAGLSSMTEKKQKQDLLLQGSSLSPATLSSRAQATRRAAEECEVYARNDPPNAKQQVTFMLDSWIRIQAEAVSNEKILLQYLQMLQTNGVGKSDDQTERFFRMSTMVVVEAVLKTSSEGTLNYNVIDVYAKLVVVLLRYMNSGGSVEQISAQRLDLLNKILGVTVRCMMWDYERSRRDSNGGASRWDQRPWFRLLLNLVIDLHSPDQSLDAITSGIRSVFATSFHVLQPLVVPGFAFAWLELVSHKKFLPNLLQVEDQKGWNLAHQLVVDMLLFLEPYLKKVELSPPIKKFYEGCLRMLLYLLHDFPDFLAAYHLSLCNVIPENCVQLRNLILSAVPKGMQPPDPFTPNLKIDLLPEVSKTPVVLSNIVGPLEGMRTELDAFLKDRQRVSFLAGLLPRLYKDGSSDLDVAKVNSLVLYVGMQALARMQNSQLSQTIAHTPEIEILQKLMDFDDKGRYTCLNAIANQLRYPSNYTHYFSCVMLYLFSEAKNVGVKEQVTRVLLERLILHRPHPWGLLVTFMELIKNQKYMFWSHPFTRCAHEIEKVFESVARSCMPPGTSTAVGGEEL